MKYLKTYNESLRDKMTPISKDKWEEILSEVDLDVDPTGEISILMYNPRQFNYVGSNSQIKQVHIEENKVTRLTGPFVVILDFLKNFYTTSTGNALAMIKNRLDESLRNKMLPKSEEEILNNLNADPNATYKKSKKSGVGTYLIGEYTTTYDVLVDLFGEPDLEDWIGNNFYWRLEGNNGRFVCIYDNNSGLEGYELIEQPYKWHIGGTHPEDANNLIGYIIRNSK